MIRFACPSCGKKFHAKPELAGRTAKCPSCGKPFQIPQPSDSPETIPLDDAAAGENLISINEEHIDGYRAPDRLARDGHYLIFDRTHLLAVWENNGAGWMIRAGAGFLPAKRNRDKLPTGGDYQLTELRFAMTPEGKRLSAITSYRLASRWALMALDQSDDAILEKATGPGSLNKDQKNAVRQVLKDHYMRPVWQDSAAILDYLGNMDYHSQGVAQQP
jgi:hypothetical protein